MMMTCKLILQNIRRHIKDYTIYFASLVIAVSLFYAFNATMRSEALLTLGAELSTLIDALAITLKYITYILAFVMAFVVLYVNNFLLKRRKKELGIYMLQGMKKGMISKIFVGENVVIGAFSLLVGNILGYFLEQLLVIASLKAFGGAVGAFQPGFSYEALKITVVCFCMIFVVVMILQVVSVWRVKLIDLLTAERKNEELKLNKMWISGVAFVVGVFFVIMAAFCMRTEELLPDKEAMLSGIVCIVVGTVLLFYSVFAVLLYFIKRNKRFYYKDINSFLVQQIGSRIRVNFTSMAMVCFLLTVTIILLTVGSSIAIECAQMSDQYAPFDYTVVWSGEEAQDTTVFEAACKKAPDFATLQEDYFEISLYSSDITYGELLEGQNVALRQMDESMNLLENTVEVLGISDYNKCLEAQGIEAMTLEENAFLLNCNYNGIDKYMEEFLESCDSLMVQGKVLHPANRSLLPYTYLMTSINNNDRGTLIVPDSLAETMERKMLIHIGEYKEGTDEELANEILMSIIIDDIENSPFGWNSRSRINTMYYSIIAMPLFLCLYVGLVFMIICVALISVQQLIAISENRQRYLILRRQGVKEKMIHSTIRKQVGVYFMAPLILAGIYASMFLPAIMQKISDFMNVEIGTNILITLFLMLLVYGGYYVMTFLSCEKVIAGKIEN